MMEHNVHDFFSSTFNGSVFAWHLQKENLGVFTWEVEVYRALGFGAYIIVCIRRTL